MNTHPPGRSLPTTPTPPRPGVYRASKHQLHAWADAAAHGDTEAFARLYESCRGWVLARCHARFPLHDAEDVCAEVFARAWRYLASGQAIEHPLAWLATVTRNLIIDHHKRSKWTIPVGDFTDDTDQITLPDPAPGPAELAVDSDIAPLVDAWLTELSPPARASVTGHLRAEDQRVTSSRTGCSLPALRSSLYRSRQQLRARLAGQGLPCPPVRRC